MCMRRRPCGYLAPLHVRHLALPARVKGKDRAPSLLSLTLFSLSLSLSVLYLLFSSSIDDRAELLLHHRFFLLPPPAELAIALRLPRPTLPSLSLFHASLHRLQLLPLEPLPSSPLACVAVPHRASAEQAAATYECEPTSWCFPTIPPPPPTLLRTPPADSPTSSVQVRVRDPVVEFD